MNHPVEIRRLINGLPFPISRHLCESVLNGVVESQIWRWVFSGDGRSELFCDELPFFGE
ncbi:MAG: hypothetical protein WA183_13110 [Chthoniobacterales bacterium]